MSFGDTWKAISDSVDAYVTDQGGTLVTWFLTFIAGAILIYLARRFLRKPSDEAAVEAAREILEAIDTAKIKPRPVNTLPRPTAHYVGDAALIRRIMATLEKSKTASLVGLAGMGGIGKTEAAVVTGWAMLEKGRFKDGALMIDLLGFAEEGAPPSHEDALRRLIAMIGGDPVGPRPDKMPEEQFVAGLSDQWKGLTVGKDLLVILDNATDAAHVAPLLPAANGPRVLITSRNVIKLPGQAESIEIARLEDDRAERLVRSLAPDMSDPEAARLVAVSLGLPLLVETLAGVIVQSPARPVADWLANFEAAGADAALPEIDRVKARLAVSVDALAAADRDRYAALSLFAGGFHAQSAYALWELEDAPGAQALGRLQRRSLLIPVESMFKPLRGPRYRLHDYLQAVAVDRFRALADPVRTGFRHRWGQEALKLLQSAESLYKSKGGDLAGLRLFEQEQGTIAAAQGWAAERAGEDDAAAGLAMRFPNFTILELRLAPRQWIGWLEAGLPAAKRLGNRRGEAMILGNLGHCLLYLGDLDGAEARLDEVLEIAVALGDRAFEAKAHGNLGLVYQDQGKYEDAEAAYETGLKIQEGEGDREGAAAKYGNLGILYQMQKRFDDAEEMFQKSLAITEELGLRTGSANQYGNLGNVYLDQGKLNQAGEALEKQLAINSQLGHRDGIATANFNLAILRLQQARLPEARQHAQTARALFAEMGMEQQVAKADALLAEIEAAVRS